MKLDLNVNWIRYLHGGLEREEEAFIICFLLFILFPSKLQLIWYVLLKNVNRNELKFIQWKLHKNKREKSYRLFCDERYNDLEVGRLIQFQVWNLRHNCCSLYIIAVYFSFVVDVFVSGLLFHRDIISHFTIRRYIVFHSTINVFLFSIRLQYFPWYRHYKLETLFSILRRSFECQRKKNIDSQWNDCKWTISEQNVNFFSFCVWILSFSPPCSCFLAIIS